MYNLPQRISLNPIRRGSGNHMTKSMVISCNHQPKR